MHEEHRRKHNEEFIRRLIRRRPELAAKYEPLLRPGVEPPALAFEVFHTGEDVTPPSRDTVFETIVNRERPVLFVAQDRLDTNQVTTKGDEALLLVDDMRNADPWLSEIMPLVGRIDVSNFRGEYVGTGWFVAEDIVVTNRHVAILIARWDGKKYVFNLGVGNRRITSSICTTHELDDTQLDPGRTFEVMDVLYIEPESGLHDIAFLRVKRKAVGDVPKFIEVASSDVTPERLVCTIGYPARAPKSVIADQQLMRELYLGRYDVKRAAPGYTMDPRDGTSCHDCTTLGGNSGSVLIDLNARKAVGLHFAGLYQETNYAVRASVLTDYIQRKRWSLPPVIESSAKRDVHRDEKAAGPSVASTPAIHSQNNTITGGEVSITIPLAITLRLGAPAISTASPPSAGTVSWEPLRVDAKHAAAAAQAFWRQRPESVIAVRVGYFDEGDTVGDTVCIAASVVPQQLTQVEASAPHVFDGVPVRYLPADASEQIATMPAIESVDSIAYDDDMRKSAKYSFELVDEEMDVLLHVGPEYSWDTLKNFLDEAEGHLVSAMYEFHGKHVKDTIERRLDAGTSLTLVLDNATFVKPKDADEDIDAQGIFKDWSQRYDGFRYVVVPEGRAGLISDAYHIKVTVRDDDTFWLSSGNWKTRSSQPLITDEERKEATDKDLTGNREWHVVVTNRTLADRFRAHILRDYEYSSELRAEAVPESVSDGNILVDVPIEETITLERRAPSSIIEPQRIERKQMKVQMLLTPDQEGAVYSSAVLSLIRSAKNSLLFQIPYIGTPTRPNERRGYIDDLIEALTEKLTTLDDARVILRTGSQKYSSPTHAAWYFKSHGVDIGERLRVIDNHHTKGMIVDGKRVLIGSHNWSKPGVSLNRDASLIFYDAEVAEYYACAFEIDWERANPIRPKKYVKPPPVREAMGTAGPAGYVRVPLWELVGDE